MKPMVEKQAGDGTITVYRDISHAYYVGKRPDPGLEKFPMGAFRTIDAARHWADEHFPGGEWKTLG